MNRIIILNIRDKYGGDIVNRNSIPTDYVQTSVAFLLIISTSYVISTDHVHPLYYVYMQLIEKIVWDFI